MLTEDGKSLLRRANAMLEQARELEVSSYRKESSQKSPSLSITFVIRHGYITPWRNTYRKQHHVDSGNGNLTVDNHGNGH